LADAVRKARVAVVGAGVVGLACACELAAQCDVTVFHDQDLLGSTSAFATAIWHVYLVDPHETQHLDWSRRTLQRLILQAEIPEAGIEFCEGVELFRTTPEHRPPWADIASDFAPLTPTELAAYPDRTWGYRIAAPTANMFKYLTWLAKQCTERGAKFRHEHISSLIDLGGEYRIVVNCTGIGARGLVNDEELYPVRGQYLVLQPNSETPKTYVGDDEHPGGMAYVIPRDREVMVGGTEEPEQWSMEFDANKKAMLARAGEFFPQDLTELVELRAVVGLRPCRRSRRVRFGQDEEAPWIVHNYGHGGSGFSLAWGCAEDASHLVTGILAEQTSLEEKAT
jgi:D-amino-acid oxidase